MTPADAVPAQRAARAPRPRIQFNLQVVRTERLSPHMVRIVAGGPDLAKFVAKDATDMYVKINFLQPGVEYAEPVDVFSADFAEFVA